VRLFFALWPDAATRDALVRWGARAHAQCGGRAMRPDTLHLTLGFLGETSRDVAHSLVHATRARRIEPGTLLLGRFGAFPRPRIVWAGPSGDEGDGAARLRDEHRCLWEWVARLHPTRPEERFRPHVTLLRDADTRMLPEAPAEPIIWRYERYVLVASVQDGASRYRIVAGTQP